MRQHLDTVIFERDILFQKYHSMKEKYIREKGRCAHLENVLKSKVKFSKKYIEELKEKDKKIEALEEMINRLTDEKRIHIGSAANAFAYVHSTLPHHRSELFVLCLDDENRVVAEVGLAQSSIGKLDIKGVFRETIKNGCQTCIVINYSNNGEIHVSNEEKMFARELSEFANIMQTRVLDYIFMNPYGLISYRKENYMG